MKKPLMMIVAAVLLLLAIPAAAYAAEEDLTAPSGLDAAGFEEIMPEALKGYGGQIYDMEEKYNINGIFLLAVIRLESGNGTSGLTQNKHNVAGNKGGNGYMSFEVMGDGIEYAAQNLGGELSRPGREILQGRYIGGCCEGILPRRYMGKAR